MRTKESKEGSGTYEIHCPGCKHTHQVYTKPVPGVNAQWGFNGDVDRPTFSPSLLIRSGHHVPGFQPGERCWCSYNAENPDSPAPFACGVCHSFIVDGNIQFLNDCTHSLAGQTVPLPQL